MNLKICASILICLKVSTIHAHDHCFQEDHFCCFGENCSIEDIESWDEIEYIRSYEYYRDNLNFFRKFSFVNVEFKEIPTGFFERFTSVESLDASENKLEKLERDTFKQAASLKILSVSFNKITSLSNMLFYYLVKLEHVDLSNNKIATLKSGVFEDCSKSLVQIDVSYNQITSISEEILDILGKSDQVRINFSRNQIKIIEKQQTSLDSNKEFNKTDFSYNKLESFDYKIIASNNIDLNNNKLEGCLDLENTTISSLNISMNNFTQLVVGSIEVLDISENLFLRNLTIKESQNLKTFKAQNTNLDQILNFVKNISSLEILDLSYARLGRLKIDDFAELTSLKELYLKKTDITNVNYGTFSHQKGLKVLDISENGFGSIDLQMLSGLLQLERLDISGNNLTKLDLYDSVRASFPLLKSIGLNNNWNCSYLAKVLKSFNSQEIFVEEPAVVVKSSLNIFGIGCSTSEQISIEKIQSNSSDKFAAKFNEIIEQVNEEKINRNNYNLDLDVLKSENFQIRNEILGLKEHIARSQLSAGTSSTNSTKNTNELRLMVEQINNITLEKQKISSDKIMLKIRELELEIDKSKLANEKYLRRDQIHELLKNTETFKKENLQSSESSSSAKFIEIAIAVILTVLIGVGLLKLKNYLKPLVRINSSHRQNFGSVVTFQTTDGRTDMKG